MLGLLLILFFVFFSSRRRHTRYWRDWSSDVCSSDLAVQQLMLAVLVGLHQDLAAFPAELKIGEHQLLNRVEVPFLARSCLVMQIGRASCRERVELSLDCGS